MKCWTRLMMVGSTFWGSVVASTKTTCEGGSSSVFSSVLEAPGVSMWTSSMMYTLRSPVVPSDALDTRSRMASTPLLEAASISMTANDELVPTDTQLSQTPQGSPSSSFSQLSALARMRAVEVLPVPRGPLKRYPWPTRRSRTALRKAWVTWSWPRTSANRPGR